MPFLLYKGISQEKLTKIIPPLIKEIAVSLDIPENYFVVELSNHIPIQNVYPHCEIKWFDRGKEKMNQFTKILKEAFLKEKICLEVVFVIYEFDKYFE